MSADRPAQGSRRSSRQSPLRRTLLDPATNSRAGNGLTSLDAFSPSYVAELRARFFAKVSPEPMSGCWLWTGAVNSRGYGSIGVGTLGHSKSIVRVAHRVAWLLERGPLPVGVVLDHLCRNHACVNPQHLEPVTHAENIRRGNDARRTQEAA